jgi:hypothetical protein
VIIFIDIGGTPANILKKDTYSLALNNGIKKEDLVAILDPFDLSRSERTFLFNGKKVKVAISSKEVNLDSEKEKIISPEGFPLSENLREFMNNLVRMKYPFLKLIKLEIVLSENKEIILDLLKKIKIPVRAVCPRCNMFRKIILGKEEMCCGVCDNEIINRGKYVPQQGFLSVITYLCGYKTFSNDPIKKEQIEKIRELIEFEGDPLVNYLKQN